MSTRNLVKIAISEKGIRKQQVMRSGWEELLWKEHQLLQNNGVETVRLLGNQPYALKLHI